MKFTARPGVMLPAALQANWSNGPVFEACMPVVDDRPVSPTVPYTIRTIPPNSFSTMLNLASRPVLLT